MIPDSQAQQRFNRASCSPQTVGRRQACQVAKFPKLNPVGLQGRFVFASTTIGWFVPETTYLPAAPITVYQTIDGGSTWHSQRISGPPDLNSGNPQILALKAFGTNSAVIELTSGKGAYVTTTGDDGLTWTKAQLTPLGNCGFGPCPIAFIDAEHWIGYGTGGLLRTVDAGANWEAVGGDAPACCGLLQFTDPSHGWSLGGVPLPSAQGGNGLFRTTDGGVHWTSLALPVDNTDLYPA